MMSVRYIVLKQFLLTFGVISVFVPGCKAEVVEGNIYFPPKSIRLQYFRESATDYECPWKGHADYYDVVVEGDVNADAARY